MYDLMYVYVMKLMKFGKILNEFHPPSQHLHIIQLLDQMNLNRNLVLHVYFYEFKFIFGSFCLSCLGQVFIP